MTPPPLRDLLEVVRESTSARDVDDRLARGQLWAGTVVDQLEYELTWPHRVGWDALALACVRARFDLRQQAAA